jgi:hypothetical protein
MKKRLTQINPLHAGKMVAALGGLYSLFVLLFVMGMVAIGIVTGNYHGLSTGLDAIAMLFIIPVFGFIYGLLGAAVYNLIAKWTGGVEFTLSDVAPRDLRPWPSALPRYPFAPR